MEKRILSAMALVWLLQFTAFCPWPVYAGQVNTTLDKALSSKMVRFGKQAYERGRYLDAKEYFRKAVQADPMNSEAWQRYDMAIIFGLAEKVEKTTELIAPDSSTKAALTGGNVLPTQPPPVVFEDGVAQLEEDEGC